MKIIKIIILLFALAISLYSLITKDFSYGPMSSLLFGIFFGVLAIEEFKNKGKNSWGILYLPVSLVIVVMALFSF